MEDWSTRAIQERRIGPPSSSPTYPTPTYPMSTTSQKPTLGCLLTGKCSCTFIGGRGRGGRNVKGSQWYLCISVTIWEFLWGDPVPQMFIGLIWVRRTSSNLDNPNLFSVGEREPSLFPTSEATYVLGKRRLSIGRRQHQSSPTYIQYMPYKRRWSDRVGQASLFFFPSLGVVDVDVVDPDTIDWGRIVLSYRNHAWISVKGRSSS